MMKTRTQIHQFVRRGLLTALASLAISLGSAAHAQFVTTTTFTRVGSSIVAIPTFYVAPTRYIRPDTLGRLLSNVPERWMVGLRTSNGVVTRIYQVDNSGIAIRRANRQFPNASLIGVRKVY